MKLSTKQIDLTQNLLMEGNGRVKIIDGSAASPSLNFVNHSNTGMYLVGPAKIGFSTSGVQRLAINTVSVTSYIPLRLQQSSTPVYSFDGDTDTGIGSSAANTLEFYSGGSVALTLDSNKKFNSKFNRIHYSSGRNYC